MTDKLFRVTSSWFVAGFTAYESNFMHVWVVGKAAPILKKLGIKPGMDLSEALACVGRSPRSTVEEVTTGLTN